MSDCRVITARGRWDEAELRRYYLTRFRRQAVVSAVIVYPPLLGILYFLTWEVWSVGFVLAFLMIGLGISLFSSRPKRAREAARRIVETTVEARFTFDADGFSSHSTGPDGAASEARVRWGAIRGLKRHPGFAVLQTGAIETDLPIPRHFFATEEAWDGFLALAEARIAAAPASTAPPTAPSDPEAHDEAAGGIALDVRLTAMDVLVVNRRHTRRGSELAWAGMTFVASFFFFGGGADAIAFADWQGLVWASAVGLAVGLGVLLAGPAIFLGLFSIYRWRAGREKLSARYRIGEDGVWFTSEAGAGTTAWSSFQQSGVTWGRLWIEYNESVAIILPRRCFASEQEWQAAVSLVRGRAGKCPGCGYPLVGNTSGQCPECGYALRLEVAAAAAPAVR